MLTAVGRLDRAGGCAKSPTRYCFCFNAAVMRSSNRFEIRIWNFVGRSRARTLRRAMPQLFQRAFNQIDIRLKLSEPLKLKVLIVSEIVQDLASLVEQGNHLVELPRVTSIRRPTGIRENRRTRRRFDFFAIGKESGILRRSRHRCQAGHGFRRPRVAQGEAVSDDESSSIVCQSWRVAHQRLCPAQGAARQQVPYYSVV